MEWIVYNFNINKQKIETYNIFEHGSFLRYIKKAIKKYKDKDEFTEKLRSELMYYFWSKAEHELIIKIDENNRIFLMPWIGSRDPEGVKIDVTDNTDFDWKGFTQKHIKKYVYGSNVKIDIYDQVMFNWDTFSSYVWENKKELLNSRLF